MKKCILCITVLVVLFSINLAYSDSIPPNFTITNVLKLSGGNDAVYVRPFDHTNRDFDVIEEDKNMYEYNNVITVLSQKRVGKRVSKNARPTAKDGLLNAGSPVEITAYGNKLTLSGWGGEGFDGIRIIDGKGKVLFEDSIKNREHPDFEFEVSSLPATYFVELETWHTVYSRTPSIGLGPLSIPLGKGINAETSEYCYVQLRMQSGRERKVYVGSQQANEEVVEMVKNSILNWALVKKHNLSSPQELVTKLTDKQLADSMQEYVRKDPDEYSIARSIAESYVKEHGIKSMMQWREIKDDDYRSMAEEYIMRINAKGQAPVRKAPAKNTKKRK